jgi:hypothetical protein
MSLLGKHFAAFSIGCNSIADTAHIKAATFNLGMECHTGPWLSPYSNSLRNISKINTHFLIQSKMWNYVTSRVFLYEEIKLYFSIFCWLCISLQILGNNQNDALFHVFIYFMSLHVSSITALFIRRSNCINTSSVMISLCKWLTGMPVTYTNHTGWCINTIRSPDDERCDAWNMYRHEINKYMKKCIKLVITKNLEIKQYKSLLFCSTSRGFGTHAACIQYWGLSQEESGCGVKLSTHLHPVPRLRGTTCCHCMDRHLNISSVRSKIFHWNRKSRLGRMLSGPQ